MSRRTDVLTGFILLGFLLLGFPTPFPAQLQSVAPVPASELEAIADSLAEQQISDGLTAGLSVAVVRGSDTLVWKGWGQADLELDVPATPETVYRVASITKQFTAALILKLNAAGTLSLEDPVTRWVELPGAWRSEGTPIKLRHLLSHTSGIPSFTEAEGFGYRERLDLTHDDVLDLVREDSLHFPPGTFFSYSNTGYQLLGMVVEEVTGRHYEAVLRDSLLAPLGLDRTRYCWEAPLIENRAEGYTRSDSVPGLGKLDVPRLVNAPYVSMKVPFSGGSLCSTVGDLVAWTQALHDGAVIPDSLLEEMTREARIMNAWGAGYGFGLGVTDVHGHRRLAHGGRIDGFRALISHYPEGEGMGDDLTVAVLANAEGAGVGPMEAALARAALGLPAPEVADRTVPRELATRVTGIYWVPRGSNLVRVFLRDGRLYVQPGEQEASRLYFQGVRDVEEGTAAVFRPEFDPEATRIDFLLPEDSATKSPIHIVRHYRLTWVKRVEKPNEAEEGSPSR